MNTRQSFVNTGSPGLLPWQILLIFFLLGTIFIYYKLVGLTVAGLLFFFKKYLCNSDLKTWSILLAFLLGWILAFFSLPPTQRQIPDWILQREKANINGLVSKVQGKPENRLEVILEKVHYKTRSGQRGQLKSNLVLKWKNPTQIPCPGQKIKGIFRVKPIKGFRNFHTWNTRLYWRLKNVGFRTYSCSNHDNIDIKGKISILHKLRLQLKQAILQSSFPGQGRGLLLAIIMADRSQLNYSTLDMMRKASLSHSLAQSGLHIGFLIGIAYALALFCSRLFPRIYLILPKIKLTFLLALPLIVSYLWLGQAKESLLRASLMFFFWGLLIIKGKNKVLLDGLFFALLVIIIITPLALYDLGLQLSIAAVTGIILYWPVLKRIIGYVKTILPGKTIKKAVSGILSLFGISLIANITLLPLTSWNFGSLSPHIYLNIIWIPVLGFVVMPLGLLGLAFYFIPGFHFLGVLGLKTSSCLLQTLIYFLQVLQDNNMLENIVILRPTWLESLGYWFLLLLLAILLQNPIKIKPKFLTIAGLMLFLPIMFRDLPLTLSKELQVKILDVGQGQSVFLQTPRHKKILVDGGGSWNKDFNLGRFALAPALTWNSAPSIDLVILSHADFDHLRGLYYILNKFKVKKFLYNGYWPEGWDGRMLKGILQEQNIPAKTLSNGKNLYLEPKLRLEVLNPYPNNKYKKDNNNSLVLQLIYNNRVLINIPGDIELPAIKKLCSNKLLKPAQVLIMPHHGSDSSLSSKLYQKINPELAVASCGYMNHFGFPDIQVKQALDRMNIPLLTTADSGAIKIVWNLMNFKYRVNTTSLQVND